MGPCQPSLGLGYLQGRSSASTTKRGFCFGPTVCVYVCVCDEQEKRENTTELVSLTSHPLQNLYKVGQASNATFGVFCGEESLTSPLGGNVGSPYPRIQKADPEVQWGSGPGETWEKSALLGWGLEEQRPEGRYWREAPPRWQRRELRTDIKTAWKAASSMDQRDHLPSMLLLLQHTVLRWHRGVSKLPTFPHPLEGGCIAYLSNTHCDSH